MTPGTAPRRAVPTKQQTVPGPACAVTQPDTPRIKGEDRRHSQAPLRAGGSGSSCREARTRPPALHTEPSGQSAEDIGPGSLGGGHAPLLGCCGQFYCPHSGSVLDAT